MENQTDLQPLVDPSTVTSWQRELPDLWQFKLLEARQLSEFSHDRGASFYRQQIEQLWQVGLLRADLIKSKTPFLDEDALDIGQDDWGNYQYISDRKMKTPTDGWLADYDRVPKLSDGVELYFHPFRFFLLHRIQLILETARGHSFQSLISRESVLKLTDVHLKYLHDFIMSTGFGPLIEYLNSIADLAIAVEPLSFGHIFGHSSRPISVTDEQMTQKKEVLRGKANHILLELGLERLEEARRVLVVDAERLDPNTNLHVILRLANGHLRENLKGRLGGSMHLLAMAEMIRLATEDAFGTHLAEEDEIGFGYLMAGQKEKRFGSKRLFDGDFRGSKEYLRSFDLDYAVRLRWYVEGDTEAGALESLFGDFEPFECVNLSGQVSASGGKGLAFKEDLTRDLRAGVFSFVAIDGDRKEFVRLLRMAAEDDIFCGEFDISDPDFEFRNFTVEELTDVAWQMALEQNAGAEWRERFFSACARASSGKEFTRRASAAIPNFRLEIAKGKRWGKLLMAYAAKSPNRIDPKSGKSAPRPFLQLAQDAYNAVDASFHVHRRTMRVDPELGRLVSR